MSKRCAFCFAMICLFAAGRALAQTPEPASTPAYQFEAGLFAEDFRLGRISPTLDMPGAGARLALFPRSWFQLELEASYDFSQTFTSAWSNGFVTDNLTTHLRIARALGGVKLNKKIRKNTRLFASVKPGLIDFTASTQNIPQGFTNPQDPATTGGTNFLLYAGGGVEYSFGRWGLRFDGGNDLYFDHGHKYNNIRVAFGPTFRF